MSESENERIKEAVRQAYGQVARSVAGSSSRSECCPPTSASVRDSHSSCCCPGEPAVTSPTKASCCGQAEAGPESCGVEAGLYSLREMEGLPGSVTGASLGCGNPVALASLKPGQVVLDLGSGGGIDCFLAARQVGPEGRVIGLDMTPDMIRLARRNARQMGVTNVDFRYGEMEEMPLPDESVDVIISNCVVNLSPDKEAVFREAFRVLRPGGRMNVSDIVTNGELPETIRRRLDAWAACISGALDQQEYLDKIRSAGFEDVEVVSRVSAGTVQTMSEDLDRLASALEGCEGCGCDTQDLSSQYSLAAQSIAPLILSITVQAHKPR